MIIHEILKSIFFNTEMIEYYSILIPNLESKDILETTLGTILSKIYF